MKINISDKSENVVLKRTEVSFDVEEANIPPSRKEVREKIAALQNVKPEQVIIVKLSHGFGSQEVQGTARIYGSVEELEKTELKYMVGRNIGVKKGKKGEAGQAAPEVPAPAKAEKEKPAEAKEEKKEEAEPAPEKKEGE
ncbi:MAG: 30S ribosomal protein S24e [Candidatus Diapherotrites archaeon]|uniref:Small ribosomal subunit protein eS24 n=1 Tax=Candidatus Iainarchaeum sp. TaxID=3101447 RepID=A0A2D6M0J6_9ARCH|nr:30S ribosomal protein S24e [Candidatus Diapherotrites archaeon]|tara:strand:- start:77 stop:496 length:420 start_codon:yes stop_codon:yes gene_type:complete